MNTFDKRPLSIILCVMLGGFVVFSRSESYFEIVILACSLLIPLLPLVIKRLSPYRSFSFVLFTSLLLSALFSHLYFDRYFKAYERFEGETIIEGEIYSAEKTTSYSTLFIIKAKSVNDENFSSYKFLMRLNSYEGDLSEGDEVIVKGELCGFDTNGDFDAESYYFSKGISASVENVDEITITKESDGTLGSRLEYIREIMRRKAILASDKDAGNLLGALLTGERSQLSKELRLDFTRIGISHVLALSGMHLAILTAAISRLLMLLGLGKRPRTITTILFAFSYMAFVGFTVSVVRAGIMLIVASFLSLVFEDQDSITSLSVAVFIICLVNPYAIYDTALWLSAFATFGVIIAAKKDTKSSGKGSFWLKIPSIIKDSLFASVLANGATLAISALSFGGFSLISPFTTLIFSLIIEVYMYLGSIILFIAFLYMPASIPIGKILIFLSDITESLAAALSSLELSYVSSKYGYIEALLLAFTVIFFILMIAKLNRLAVSLCVTVLFFAVFVTAAYYKLSDKPADMIAYSSSDKADLFLIRSEGEDTLVSSSQYSKGRAYEALDLLSENKITELDLYVLTHYAYGMEEDLETLLSSVLINEISIPYPRNEEETLIYDKLKIFLSDYRVKLSLHNSRGNIKIGNFVYLPVYSHPYGEGSSVNAAMIIHESDYRMLYLSSGMLLSDYEIYRDELLGISDAVVFGSHGKKYKEPIYFKEYSNRTKEIILAGDNLFFNQQTYKEYKEGGCKIISHPPMIELFRYED